MGSILGLAWGRGEEVEKGDYAYQVTYLRRRLSSASVTAFGRKLASRMAQVGPGAALAKGRRQQWGREEEWARRAREADWLEKVSIRSLGQKGRFWSKPQCIVNVEFLKGFKTSSQIFAMLEGFNE